MSTLRLRMTGLIFVLASQIPVSLAQVADTLYFSKNWKLTTPENASFIRFANVDTTNLRFVGPVTDYFRSGKIFMAGNYNTNGLKNGLFQLFYENGNPFVKVTFSRIKWWEVYTNTIQQG